MELLRNEDVRSLAENTKGMQSRFLPVAKNPSYPESSDLLLRSWVQCL